jgi:signal peptidase I
VVAQTPDALRVLPHPPSASTRLRARIYAGAGLVVKIGVLVLMLTMLRAVVADQYHVPTPSMAPTIEPGDRIFVSKAAFGLRVPFTQTYLFHLGGPSVGDVIIFGDPRGGPIALVKRVVALEGQTVRLERGVLWIDGVRQRIEELSDGTVVEHLGAQVHAAGEPDFVDFGPYVVPTGHVFVMGDNRATSLDSRELGPVPEHLLRGKVVGIVYGNTPARRLRALDALSPRPSMAHADARPR